MPILNKEDYDTEVLVVQGQIGTMKNGDRDYVIIQIVCKNQEDAEKIMENRGNIYKKLQIRTLTKKELYNK